MRLVMDTLGGMYELLRLGILTGFRFRGPYWQWRLHTAFGKGYPARGELVLSVIRYARWVHQMRRMH